MLEDEDLMTASKFNSDRKIQTSSQKPSVCGPIETSGATLARRVDSLVTRFCSPCVDAAVILSHCVSAYRSLASLLSLSLGEGIGTFWQNEKRFITQIHSFYNKCLRRRQRECMEIKGSTCEWARMWFCLNGIKRNKSGENVILTSAMSRNSLMLRNQLSTMRGLKTQNARVVVTKHTPARQNVKPSQRPDRMSPGNARQQAKS